MTTQTPSIREALQAAIMHIAHRSDGITTDMSDDNMLDMLANARDDLDAQSVQSESHYLYKTGDSDAPDVLKDRNGEVVLAMCRKCSCAEAELEQTCTRAALSAHPEPQPVATVRSKYGDPESFGERELGIDEKVLAKLPYGTKLYASTPTAAQEPAHPVGQEDIEHLKFDIRQAMIEYGSAYKNNHEEGIRETTSRCCALLDSLAILSSKEQRNADR